MWNGIKKQPKIRNAITLDIFQIEIKFTYFIYQLFFHCIYSVAVEEWLWIESEFLKLETIWRIYLVITLNVSRVSNTLEVETKTKQQCFFEKILLLESFEKNQTYQKNNIKSIIL